MELTKEQLRALLKRWFALYGGSTSEDRFSQAEMTALDRDTDLALRGLGGTTQEPLAVTEELPTTYRACDQNGDWREFEEIRSIRPAANRVLEMLESEGYGSTEATDALRTALECRECPDADCSDCPRKPARWVPQS